MVETLPEGAKVEDIPKFWEGTISKLKNSRYESGKRRASWQKYKFKQSATLRVIGLTPGIGARASTFGSAIVADQNGVTRGQVGSGFTDDDIQLLMDAQVTGDWPLIEVEYRFLSGKNGLLVNTAYKGIRKDKTEADSSESILGAATVESEKLGPSKIDGKSTYPGEATPNIMGGRSKEPDFVSTFSPEVQALFKSWENDEQR